MSKYDDLLGTLTPTTLNLIAAIRRDKPGSINEAARMIDRDVKNVYEQLLRLESLGVIYFVEEGQSKRPVVWFDDLVIDIDVTDNSEAAGPTPA